MAQRKGMCDTIYVITKNEDLFYKINIIVKSLKQEIRNLYLVASDVSLKHYINNQVNGIFLLDIDSNHKSLSSVIQDLKEIDPSKNLILIKNKFSLKDAVRLAKAGATDLIETHDIPARLETSLSDCLDSRYEIETELKISDFNRDIREVLNNYILNSFPNVVFVVNDKGQIISVNNRFREQLGFRASEIEHVKQLVPNNESHKLPERFEELFNSELVEGELKLKTKKNREVPYFLTAVSKSLGNTNILVGTGIDITDKKKQEKRLVDALQEKEILLSEVHHRVKNNLALISGLMQLQAFQAQNEEVFNYLNDNQNRIKSIALIHEELYEHKDFKNIRLDKKLKRLVGHISDSIRGKVDLKTTFTFDRISVNINQAVPFSLLVNEVTTNIYKHGFNGKKRGHLKISLQEENEEIILIIEDNGIGLDKNFNIEEADSLGMTLIKTLSAQLNGQIHFIPLKKGTRFVLKFKKQLNSKGSGSNLK